MVTALVVALVGLTACGGGGGGDSGGKATSEAAGSWRPMSAGPLSGRSSVPVWTGREMVVWGGGSCKANPCQGDNVQPLADGAAYDPAADTWRRIAPSPLSARSDALTVWSGKEVLVWGGESWTEAFADGAAYDPATDRWRPLAAGPLKARIGFAHAWTGKEVLMWGGTPGTFNNYFADGAAYDPAGNRWRALPTTSGRLAEGVWTGQELLVWGGIVPAPGGGRQTTPIQSAADGYRLTP